MSAHMRLSDRYAAACQVGRAPSGRRSDDVSGRTRGSTVRERRVAGHSPTEPRVRPRPGRPSAIVRRKSGQRRWSAVDQIHPVLGHPVRRGRSALTLWPAGRRSEFGTRCRGLCAVVPEPVLARLEAGHDRVAGAAEVRGGVLPRRGVAAPHVTAGSATAQMHPPPVAFGQALHAAVAAGRRRRLRAR